jgi:hypothetical protein
MTMREAVTALLLLGAAACSGPAPMQNEAANRASEANDIASAQQMGNRIAALPEPQRLATLYRAIHDAGMDCQDVTSAAPGDTYRGMPVWNARCRGGGQWTIVIASGGVAQVLNASETRLVTDQAPPANAQSGR